MSLFSFGSCRSQNAIFNINPNIRDNQLKTSVQCHYLSEINQNIQFLLGEKIIPSSHFKYIFVDALNVMKFKTHLSNSLKTATKIIVEISSIKNSKTTKYYCHLSAIRNKNFRYEKTQDTYEDIIEKIKICNDLLQGRTTLYIPHLNAETKKGFLKARGLLQEAVHDGADQVGQQFYDMMDAVNEVGYAKAFGHRIDGQGKDFDHLRIDALRIVKKYIKKKFLGM
jgi:hypothetical protein